LIEDVDTDESQQPQRNENSQSINDRKSEERDLEYSVSERLEGMLGWLLVFDLHLGISSI
jgi:23S rRNA maturation mini-RNase III